MTKNVTISDEEILQLALIGYKIRKKAINQEMSNLRNLLGITPVAVQRKRSYYVTPAGKKARAEGLRRYWAKKRRNKR